MEADRDHAVTGRVMVYDGDCPMCRAISATFVRLGMVPEGERRPFQDYSGETADRIWEAGIRNEIVILDPESGELRAGAAGILWMLRNTWIGPLARFLEARPLCDLVAFPYRFVAYNRRFVSVPRPTGLSCACDPEERPGYHLALITLASGLAATGLYLFGVVAEGTVHDGLFARSAPRWCALLGAGWAIPAAAALARLGGRRVPYLGHLAVTALVGALLLLPAAVLAPLLPALGARFVLVLSIAASYAHALRLQRVRLAYLGLARSWVVLWALAVPAGGAVAVALLDALA